MPFVAGCLTRLSGSSPPTTKLACRRLSWLSATPSAKERCCAYSREQGIPIRRQSMTAADIEQAMQLYEAGQALATIGAKLGYDHGTIHRALRQAGAAMRDSHGRER